MSCRVLALVVLVGAAHGETLDDAFAVALKADLRLAAGARQVTSAQSGLDAAKGLALPQVSVDALYNRLSDEPAFRIHIPPLPAAAPPFAQDKGWIYRAGVTLPLYTSGRLGSMERAASATLDAATVDTQRAAQDVKLGVAEAYVAVLRARRQNDLAESGVATLLAHEVDVTRFYERGLVARNDLLAARSAASNAQQDRIRAATALQITEASYNRQLGRPLSASVTVADLKPAAAGEGGSQAAQDAAPARAELVALARQSDALRHQSQAARAAGRPQVVLTAGYDRIENRYLVKDGLWTVGIGMHWSLFDGSVSRSQADALAARAAAVEDLRADLESQLALQVRATRLMVEESRSRIGVAESAVEQADENFRVARDRYQSGVGTNTEVLDAETLRLKSRSNLFNAVYDNVLAVLRLKRANDEL